MALPSTMLLKGNMWTTEGHISDFEVFNDIFTKLSYPYRNFSPLVTFSPQQYAATYRCRPKT
jgi:hypothetical protein